MDYKKKILILTTDTHHHRFLIKILDNNPLFELIVFFIKEKKTKKKFDQLQDNFEKKNFFQNKKKKLLKKVYYFNDVNSRSLQLKLKKINPKVGIIFGTKKVSLKTIKIFKYNLLNIHRGIMEKYRGLDSEYWAIFHNDYSSIGTTIHFANEYLDKGKIIFQKRLKLKKNMKAYQLRYHTTKLIEPVIINVLKNIISKKIKTKKKQKIGKYYSHMPELLKNFVIKKFDNHCKDIKK